MALFSSFFGRPSFEQHVAVFGESGSGKTTLLSVFYGSQQAANFTKLHGYSLLADDTTQGNRMLQAYHRIAEDKLPPATKYQHVPFVFNVRADGSTVDAGRLVWHDYPGEWWTETKSGDEADRKNTAFRDLLGSDLAILLVDGVKYRDQGKNYLTHLLKSFRDEIERLRSKYLEAHLPLSSFPRVWLIALSKADALPGKTVEWFRDEVIKNANDEINALRDTLKSLVARPDCLALGEDFLLLSSAQFDDTASKVVDASKRLGVDVISPLSVTAPLQWARRWSQVEKHGERVTVLTLEGLRGVTTAWMRWIPFIGGFFDLLDESAKQGIDGLKKAQETAVAKGENIDAVLAAFIARLKESKDKLVYLSSVNR